MAMVIPCPPQPITERDQDCWCEELVDVEKSHEVPDLDSYIGRSLLSERLGFD